MVGGVPAELPFALSCPAVCRYCGKDIIMAAQTSARLQVNSANELRRIRKSVRFGFLGAEVCTGGKLPVGLLHDSTAHLQVAFAAELHAFRSIQQAFEATVAQIQTVRGSRPIVAC